MAIDAASAGRNWFASWKMNTGAVSVSPEMFPEIEHHASELADAAREGQERTADDRGADRGEDDLPEREPGTGAEGGSGLLLGRVQLQEDRLHLPDHERQRDDAERQEDPEHREGDLDADALQRLVRSASSDRRG